jgi:hypothetical protein
LLAVGGFDESFGSAEDWELWIRMVLAGATIGLVNAPLATYRMTPGSLTDSRVTQWQARRDVLAKTLRDPRLSAEQRDIVRSRMEEFARDSCLAIAEEALRTGADDARAKAFVVVRRRDAGLAARAKALAAVIAPRAAARLIARRSPSGAA